MVTVTQTSASEPAQVTPSEAAATASTPTTTNNNPHDLTVTASCAARIRQLASSRPNPDAVYLRLFVDAGGCSGFQYKFLLLSEDGTATTDHDDDEEEEDGTIDPEEDIVYTVDGARLVVDQTSLDLLRGSTIDYVQEMIRSSFAVVNNPNSESACGCGSSFAVKKFEANPALD
jgi:Fe-S cluster assembly iron-binding protein IscA